MSSLSFNKRNRSAFENFLRAKYEMYTGAAQVGSLPYYLCLDPSDACQLRCPTCPTGIENESRRKGQQSVYRNDRHKMTIELCDALLDEMGEYLFLVMFYNYGEPLLNQRLPELLRKASALDIETEVHSNLSLPLSDERIDELLSSGLGRLSASVDGFSQETYEVHRVGGNLDLVKRNLERLAAARDRLKVDTEIIYKFLVFKHNEHEVEAAAGFSADLGIQFLFGDAFIHDPSWLPSHRQHEEPYYSADDMKALIGEWEAAGRGDYFFEHERSPFWSLFPRNHESAYPSACAWHYSYSVVTAGGPIAPCCAVAKDKDDFGTIEPGEVRFADVWNNEKYTDSRRALSGHAKEPDGNETVCTRCYFPKFIHHLFSVHDSLVASRFNELHAATEPAMAKAFALLGGDGIAPDPKGYVSHYERYLSSIPSSI